ncbi:glyoxylate reductase/hydroxypyruvate reductase [Elysia marginata]|uniref:Glyoxylate reductase/hydroxypyruvate reductase n=1 Tax=Elysia marginata TaxID=1093978 RepID=A0AAV4JGU4_9GAST|nr:glyoxylate reductase/hydroxypyruvate reductase [Elysia marginata]
MICQCLGGGKQAAEAVKAQPEVKKSTHVAEGVHSKLSKSAGFRKSVYVTRTIHEDALAILEEKFNVHVWRSDHTVPREKMLQEVENVSAIVCTAADEIDDEILSAAGSSLKVICSMTSSLHHIDQEACRKRGIILHHVADLCADAKAEYTIALLLVTCKRLIEGSDAVRKGEWHDWSPMWLCGADLKNKTLGFLGSGQVAYRMAKRLEGFEIARMLCYSSDSQDEQPEWKDVNVEKVEGADQIFAESDFIVCDLPVTEETKNFVNKTNLSLCKPDCVLVNTSRPEVINQEDLLACLEEGTIGGAGLDVTTPEPLPPTHPLLEQPRCVITPHIGTATSATRRRKGIHLANTVVDMLLM